MKFSKDDQIKFYKEKVVHQSAGGFVFFESPADHALYVALLKKKDGKYYIPKGHILKGEEPEEAAIREVVEELGLDNKPNIIFSISIDSYNFTLENDKRKHFKNVHLYVFNLSQKENIKPLEKEGFISAEWLEFYDALDKIAFDKDNLLRARQIFYYNKPIDSINGLQDIKSISIAIPTYNGAKTIYQTLDSIVKSLEALPNSIAKEIIICLDHCKDDTESIIQKFISNSEFNNIKVIINDGMRGKSTSLNKMFSLVSSNLFCFIDDDVVLEKDCLLNLIKELVKDKKVRCVFAEWERNKLISKNPWKRFWHLILGIKFDIQPYDKPSEIMRGPCLMLRRSDFVRFPDGIYNEDQFLQYIYWPGTREAENAVVYFNSVSSMTDYYKRFIRIGAGFKQLEKEFSKERIEGCNKDLFRKIDYKRIFRLPLRQKLPFLFYRFVRFFISFFIKIRLSINENYEWFRIKQN